MGRPEEQNLVGVAVARNQTRSNKCRAGLFEVDGKHCSLSASLCAGKAFRVAMHVRAILKCRDVVSLHCILRWEKLLAVIQPLRRQRISCRKVRSRHIETLGC
jgi:hypothetical protein